LLLLALPLQSAEIRVAVASNFNPAMQELAGQFESESGHRLLLSFGSTGKHYAQIVNGAPFDAFFAADSSRPRLLESEGRITPGSRVIYALGRLVLWSPLPDFVDAGGEILRMDAFRHLAIANPRLAPYGEAARQVLENLGLRDRLEPRLVRGENIGQAFQFVRSGNADLGFVADSQLVSSGLTGAGSTWIVPSSLYEPIVQQAVQLTPGEPVRSFLEFVTSGTGRQIIRKHGYDLPDAF
jgi:molybdate transport system substrate-binding protein